MDRLKNTALCIVGSLLILVMVSCASASPTEDPRPETPGAETPEQVMPTPEAVVATPAPTVSLEDPAPTEEPKEEVSYSPLIWVNNTAPSVNLQIFDADVIVVASLVSATAGVQQVGDVYRPGQILRFRSSEYLKGTGPTEFVVEVPIVEFEANTSAKALEIARDYFARRNASYDQRPGILFLRGPLTAATIDQGQSDTSRSRSDSSSTTAFNFASDEFLATSSWEYSIDTIERVWMPAKIEPPSSTSRTRTPQNSDPEYITDGQTSAPTVIRLSELKTKISALATRLAGRADIPGFNECVRYELDRERYYRDWDVYTVFHTIPSGAGPDSQVLRDEPIRHGDSVYQIFHLSGKDASYFQAVIVDDDDDPARYSFKYTPSRPLPAGLYEVSYTYQGPEYIPCGFIPDPVRRREVTVTAPAGTLHEAFFDPVTVGTAVKADSSNGVLKPTSFTVGSTATDLTSLEWASNQVVLTLGTHVSLSGQALEFIGLDGSVILSLFADEATANSTAGTYTWTMSSQPWEDGDKLMLRIRPVGTEIFLTNLPSSMVQGVTHWFMVNLTNLNRSRSYSYQLSADNANVAFHNSACHSAPVNVTVSAGETSYTRQHALLGCGTPGSTVTATLMEGANEVDTTTYSVTVTPPPPPSVAIESLASSMEEGENDQFVINASHLDTAHGHTIRLTTDNGNMGFDAECTDREEDLTVGRGSAAYVDSRRLYGCTAPGGTLTVTLLQGETVVDTTTYDVEVTPPPSPSVEFLNSPYTLESGGSVVVRMRVSNLDADSSYTIRVSPDNASLGYNQDCTSREFSDGTSGRNSFSTFFTLYGCASPGGTLTVTLLGGDH